MDNMDKLQNNLILIANSSYGVYMYNILANYIANSDKHNCNIDSLNNVINECPNNTILEYYWDDVADVIDCEFIINNEVYSILFNEDIWIIKKSILNIIDEDTLNDWYI